MKNLKISLVLSIAGGLLLAADSASLSGKWEVHSSIAGNESDQSCVFTQKDNELTGTCTSADKPSVEITGKSDGKKVSWSYKSEYNGTPLTVQFEGTVGSDNTIKGSVNVPEFGADGDFTATQSK